MIDTTLVKHFGLRDQPFGVTPDPRYLYESHTHREALASLTYGLSSERGFLALIGEPGMGKTTLLFRLLEKYRQTALTAFLFQTQCGSREFLAYLLEDLGLDCPDSGDLISMHRRFNEMLGERASTGQRCIIVIDEAQNLDNQVLETVRLLSDFETSRSKLLQIVLAGQPALGEKLADPSLAQLRQRIAMQCTLTPLSPQEVDEYIACRLRVAGYTGKGIFTPEARGRIADLSEGIPRVISNVCFSAMSLACAMGKQQVSAEVIEEVSSDLGLQAGAEPIPSDKQSEFRHARNKPSQLGAAQDSNIPRLAPPSAPRTRGTQQAWGTQGHHAAATAPPSSITAESTRTSKPQRRRGFRGARMAERTVIAMACGAAILASALAWLAHRTQGSGAVSPTWNSSSSTPSGSVQKSALVAARTPPPLKGERSGNRQKTHLSGEVTPQKTGMLVPVHVRAETLATAKAKAPPMSESPEEKGSIRGTLEEVVQPVYPEEAREAAVEGTVTLQAIVDATGNVRHVRVLEGKPLLAEAALHAVRRWRYRPYLENGSPAMFRTIIRIRFILDDVSP